MKTLNRKKHIAGIMIVCMIALTICQTAALMPSWAASSAGKEVSILVSHDMHSHLEKFPKIKTLIQQKKKQYSANFVLDAGDFSMGTPYQTIYKQEASELRMMGAVGYDVTTIGNHEFDYRSKGLASMLNSAKKSKDKLPQVVLANVDWERTLNDPKLSSDAAALKSALTAVGAKDYTVVERGGVKIAVFGIFGEEAASYAPESGTYFKDPVETAKDVVEKIHAHEKVDMIVCISHGGTNQERAKDSEDEILASEVDGIDLILSGHSHTRFDKPVVVNDTVLASVGQYNNDLGSLVFKEKDGKFVLDAYKLIPLDGKVKNDEKTAALVDKFKGLVNKKYFSDFGYSWDQVLAKNNVKFTSIDDFGMEQGEDTLGNLIADSYKYGVKKAEGKDYEHVDVAVAPAGVIRGSFEKGNITVSDSFNALSLGTGKDGIAGYPLVSVYLTGKELKLAAEIDISISEIMGPARLYMSGISYTYNPHRLILNKAYDIRYIDSKGKAEKFDDERLYRVVADLYSAQMLATVNSISKGLLSIVPKNSDGSDVTNFEDCIIYNPDGSELKEWYALASYIDGFKGNTVPSKYAEPQGRKVLVDSRSPFAWLKSPNRFFWMIIAAGALIISLLTLIIVLIVKGVRRLRYGKYAVRRKDMIFRRR